MRSNILMYVILSGTMCLNACDPELQGKCNSNAECIEGFLCNKDSQCIEVEQKEMQILNTQLDDAIVGSKYLCELKIKGGLPPYTWQITKGPGWLKVEENSQSGLWELVGTPLEYRLDAATVELHATDSSLGDGQTEIQKLSIRILYCNPDKQDQPNCSSQGTCQSEGLCVCNLGYSSHQCEKCQEGYERNSKQECVTFEYKCDTAACGADILRRECVGDKCDINWTLYTTCPDDAFCTQNGNKAGCFDCGDSGCSNGSCNTCPEGSKHNCWLPLDSVCKQGTMTCTNGKWGECTDLSPSEDRFNCGPNCAPCKECKKCEVGVCINQSNQEDLYDDCNPHENCGTGFCNGEGGCYLEPAGKQCTKYPACGECSEDGICKSTNPYSSCHCEGNCNIVEYCPKRCGYSYCFFRPEPPPPVTICFAKYCNENGKWTGEYDSLDQCEQEH